MGNCIVHVQQVKIVNLRHFRHARGQRQVVGRILEERILRYLNFMIVNMWVGRAQANGLRVSDEMHIMSALRQFHAQFGGHHSAPTVGGITCDSDLHLACSIMIRKMQSGKYRWLEGRERFTDPPSVLTRSCFITNFRKGTASSRAVKSL